MESLSNFSKSGGFGSLGGLASSIYGLFNNPYDEGMKYLNQVQPKIDETYKPYSDNNSKIRDFLEQYITRGNQSGEYLNPFYKMLSTPQGSAGLFDALGSTYKKSPAYDYRLNQSIDAANRVASAGGMLGSPAEQEGIAYSAGQMANEDFGNYVNSLIKMLFGGISGLQSQENLGSSIGVNQYNTNANMADRGAQLAITNLLNQAETSENSGGFVGNMISNIGSFL